MWSVLMTVERNMMHGSKWEDVVLGFIALGGGALLLIFLVRLAAQFAAAG